MVVVAIIGVLATVAIPRFNIFRARARQGEAKSNLGVIFTLQKAFKIDKESYYNGIGEGTGGWGGVNMDKANGLGYFADGNAKNCAKGLTNKLGFRLANCAAARYRYFISDAAENQFLAVAYGKSDVTAKRIFPGCNGQGAPITKPSNSTATGAKKCVTGAAGTGSQEGGATFAATAGGMPFVWITIELSIIIGISLRRLPALTSHSSFSRKGQLLSLDLHLFIYVVCVNRLATTHTKS